MGTFVLIEGIYDTMDLFSEEIRQELTESGHIVYVLHTDSMDRDLQGLLPYVPQGIDGVISFNNIAYNLGEDQGGNLWEALHTTYIDILMDHPFHYSGKLSKLPKGTQVYCIDRNHVKFLHRFYPDLSSDFLPHKGCRKLVEGKKLPAMEDRRMEVLYAGNLSRVFIEQLIPDFGQYPEVDGVAFSQNVLTDLITHPHKTTEAAIEEELKGLLGEVSEGMLLDYIDGFRFLDGFAVSYYRELAVRVLVENNIPVHVLGVGWELCDWADNPNFIYEGKVEAPEVIDYMANTKIVLNTLTWFKDGAHDRIFNGMLAGAAVVSDTSVWLEENFENHRDLELFSLEEIQKLPDIVGGLLADSDRLKEMAARGREEALQKHTWRNLPLI